MKYKVLTLASAAAMLAACSDTSISDGNDQIKDGATVVFTTLDNRTKLPLEDVSVFYRSADKTKETDSAGTSIWRNVQIGDQYFDLYKEGYAFKRITVNVKDNITNDVSRVDDVNEEHLMYELGVGVKGQFFYVDEENDQNLVPAAGVTIYAKYSDPDIYPNEIYTVTDSNGFYSFENLATDAFTLSSEAFVLASDSAKVYKALPDFETISELKGVNKDVKPYAAQLASLEPVLLASNLKEIPAKDPLKLTFSEVLYKDSVNTNNIYVENSKGVFVAVAVSLDKDGKTVIVKPASGSWVDGQSYTVYFDVWSTLHIELDGSAASKNFTVGTLKVPGQVKAPVIDMTEGDDPEEIISYSFYGSYTYKTELEGKSDLSYDEDITIKWNSIAKNVDGYYIYAKGNGEKELDYTLIGATNSAKDTTFTLSVSKIAKNLDYPLVKEQTQKISVIVIPYNDAGEAVASEAKALTIETGAKAKAKIVEMMETTYLSDAVYSKKFNSSTYVTEAGTFYTCTDASSGCSAISLKSQMTRDYYSSDIKISWKYEDDYDGIKPNGYDVYIKKGDNEWAYAGYSTSNSYTLLKTNAVSPFKNGNLKYDSETSKKFTFAVVPFFYTNDNSNKVSQIDLDSSKGVKKVTANLQDAIDAMVP